MVLWGWLPNGRRAAVLVEVKLTEGGFTHCNGRTSRGNRRKDVCRSARLFFDKPQDCYLRRPVRKERDRRYWDIFAQSHGSLQNAFPNADLDGECPFAHDMQQPMRNLAIAQGLVQEDMVQKAWYILCAHDSNPDVAGHWQSWQQLLGDTTPTPFLPASEVIAVGEKDGLADWAEYMRARYQLQESCRDRIDPRLRPRPVPGIAGPVVAGRVSGAVGWARSPESRRPLSRCPLSSQ